LRISTRGRYAVRAMVDLASHSKEMPVTLADISKRQDISLNYLEQLFHKLRKKELVRSVRGPGGGFLLNRSTRELSVRDILFAVDEDIYPVHCVRNGTFHQDLCERLDQCVTRIIWKKLGDHIDKVLGSITLEEMCKESRKIQKKDKIIAEKS
jgi:Rrf2 family protein